MTGVDLSLLGGAAIAALLSVRSPRGLLWLAAIALSYAVSVLVWRAHVPFAEVVAGLCDAAVCLAIYFGGRYRWELMLWRLFQISLAVNMLYLAGNLGIFVKTDHNVYSIMLETINWLALGVIGGRGLLSLISAIGTAMLQRPGAHHGLAHTLGDRLRGADRSLRSERTKPPFTAR